MKLASKYRQNQIGLIRAFLLVVIVLCGLFLLFILVGKNNPSSLDKNRGSSLNSSSISDTGKINPLLNFLDPIPSSSGGYLNNSSLSIGSGNASYEIQTFSEYVSISNTSKSSINITGYTLTNAKGDRPIETTQNQNITNASPDRATISQGTKYLSPSANYVLQDIILEPGGTAYVITGGPFVSYPMPISTSFQENKCEGYLSKIYPFTPYLSNICPRAEDEVGANNVSSQCFDYLKTIYTCQDAKKENKKRYEEQTTLCQQFVDTVTNYEGCYNRHVGDSNFLSKNWRVFLGRSYEMWASRNESIRLYDRNGKLVNQVSY